MIRRLWVVFLTLVAGTTLALALVTLFYAIIPIDFAGPGKLGFVALLFPLHMLVPALVMAVVAVLAWRMGAAWALRLRTGATLVFALLAAVPAILTWKHATDIGAVPSLGAYLANAAHPNVGGPRPERTVVYGTASNGDQLLLDVWRATNVPAGQIRPAILKVHGGAWIHGTRSGSPAWNTWLNDLGYDVFDVEYRMPPPDRWREEIGDVRCALAWIGSQAATLNLDLRRISIMGYSAGGNLALLAAYGSTSSELPMSCFGQPVPVRSVINLYGPADLTLFWSDSGSLAYVRQALQLYIGHAQPEQPDRYRLLSPLTHIGPSSPPTITLQGESDRVVPVRQQRGLDEALRRAGVTHELYLFPASDHGFDVNWGGFATQAAREKIKAFLEKHG